jgi:hypothetical protein
VGFNITDQLLVHVFCICQILKKRWECNETVHQLFIDFNSKEGYIVQYSHRVWGTMKLGRLIKMCLYKSHSRVHADKHLSDSLLIQSDIKAVDALSHHIYRSHLE